MSTLQVVWARYTGAFLFPSWSPIHGRGPVSCAPAGRCSRSAGRSCCFAFTMCNFAALRYLQLARRSRLFSLPLSSSRRCRDRSWANGWAGRWAAIAVGFVGVPVVTRPSRHLSAGGAALAHRRAVLRTLLHRHARAGAHRFPTRPRCSTPTGGRSGAHSGGAVRLDHAIRPAGLRADGCATTMSAMTSGSDGVVHTNGTTGMSATAPTRLE